MRRLALAVLCLGLVTTPATAGGWRNLDGQHAPEITATQWLHVEEGSPSIQSLEGKVWLLNFMGIH